MERNRNVKGSDNSSSGNKGNERRFYRNTDPHDKAIKVISTTSTSDKVVSPFKCVRDDNFDNIFNDNNNYQIIEPKPFTSSNNINTCNTTNNTFPFVEAILINGISPSSTKFIPNSLSFPSSCNHKECSILPALSPHLLQVRNSTFTNASSSLNINANFDCISFPLGIKLCYKYSSSSLPKNDDIYFNIIHDKKGTPHYIVSFTYYIIHSVTEFKAQFKVDPITEYTIQLSNNVSIYNDETIQRNFNTLSDFVLNETVLVPQSVSLVSQFPYINQLKLCIRQMIAIKHDNKVDDVIEHILNHVKLIVNDYNYQHGVMFYLPQSSTPIELRSPCNNTTINECNPSINDVSEINYSLLFSYLNVKQIIYIFNLLLREKSILFISKDNKRISETMLILLNMMYPLQWKHTFSPVLNCYITLSLQSPTPFIFGMHPQLLTIAIQNNDIQSESTFVINLDNDVRFHYTNPHIDELPLSLYDIIYKELDKVKRSCKGELHVNEKMTTAFTKGLVVVLGEYKRFVFYTENYAVPFFDGKGFVEYVKGQTFYKESKYVKLIEDVLCTQNFMQFLLMQKDNFFNCKEYFNNVNEQFVKEIQDKQIRKAKRSASLRAHSLTKLQREIVSGVNEMKCPFTKLNHKYKTANNNNITRLYILYPYFLPAVPNDLSINKKIIENLISRKLTREKQTDITKDNKESPIYITTKQQNKFNNISSLTSSKLKYTYPLITPSTNVQPVPSSSSSSSSALTSPFEIDTADKNALLVFFKDIFIHKTLPENTQDIINSYFNEDNQIEQQHITINDSCIIESNINGIIYKLHFCKYLIYNIRLYSDNQTKLITISQFDILYKITRNCLLTKIDDKDLSNRECFLMYKGYTITLFVYYKIIYDPKKKVNAYFLYQEFKNCNIKCDVWLNTKFWEMFIMDEIDKRNIHSNCNEILKLMKDICALMIKLELKSVIIKNSLLSTFSKELLSNDNDNNRYIQLEDFILNEFKMNNNNIYI